MTVDTTKQNEPKSFKQQILDDLKTEISKDSRVIVFDRYGYLLGIASNKQELVTLLKNKETCGAIANNTSFGSVGYIIPSKKKVIGTCVIPRKPDIDPAYFSIVGEVKYNEMPNPAKIYERTLSNNDFIREVYDRLSNYNHIEVERFSNRLTMEVREEVVTLYLTVNNVTFNLSELQLSIVTNCGTVMVHNEDRDLHLNELADLVCDSLSISESELEEILLG